MDGIKDFLESSTIHGVTYVSTTRKYVRIFWIFVVISGFSTAGYLINQSFKSWNESPISTIVETRPITELTFPKVTVCPPKNTYTDLNYDLMMTENMTLDNDTMNELIQYSVEFLIDDLYTNIMKNLSLIQDNDRYYNWYHGNTPIAFPHYECLSYDCDGIVYDVDTNATSGTIFTQYFGQNFDASKVDTDVALKVRVFKPDGDYTQHFVIEKTSMKDLTVGKDELKFDYVIINGDTRSFNYTYPETKSLNLVRKVTRADLQTQKLDIMPGFKITWYYSESITTTTTTTAATTTTDWANFDFFSTPVVNTTTTESANWADFDSWSGFESFESGNGFESINNATANTTGSIKRLV